MPEVDTNLRAIENTLQEHNNRIIHITKQHDELDDSYHRLNLKIAEVSSDVKAYTIQHGQSIKTLQEAVQALKDLTSELKQESKLQEKAIESVIHQMKEMNNSINTMSKTFNKFLYIGSGVLISITLISNGTITKFLANIGGAG